MNRVNPVIHLVQRLYDSNTTKLMNLSEMGATTMQQRIPSQYIDEQKLRELVAAINGPHTYFKVTRSLDKYVIQAQQLLTLVSQKVKKSKAAKNLTYSLG